MGYEGAGPGSGKEANDADCFSIVCFHCVLRICVGNSVPIYSVPFRTGYFWYFLDLNFFWVNSIITACKDFIESSIHLWYIEEFASFCVCAFSHSNTYMCRNIGRTVRFSTVLSQIFSCRCSSPASDFDFIIAGFPSLELRKSSTAVCQQVILLQ